MKPKNSSMSDYAGTYIAWGPPGCGKTTFLSAQVREIVNRLGPACPERNLSPVMVCSLTRTAATEVAGRDLPIEPDAVGTLHAMAYRAIGRPQVAEGHLDDWNKRCDDPAYRISNKGQRPVTDVDSADDAGWDRNRGAGGADLLNSLSLLRARMIAPNIWPTSIKRFAAAWNEWKTEADVIDFTDMISKALDGCPEAPNGPAVVIGDEAQDYSALEFALLRKWGKAAGALIIAGDPWQALYTWRGAHPEAFDDPAVPSDRRRVLSQSYRVPRAVHAVAMRWVRRQLSVYRSIEYRPRDADGSVVTCTATIRDPQRAVRIAMEAADNGKTVMLAATCGYMLGPALGLLRREGAPFSNPWRRKRGDWNPLKASRGMTISQRLIALVSQAGRLYNETSWTAAELESWTAPLEAARTLRRGAKMRISELAEKHTKGIAASEAPVQLAFAEVREFFRADAFHELMNAVSSERSLLAWWRDRLLASRIKTAAYALQVARKRGAKTLSAKPRLFIGTVHSFKGAEADVVILFPDLSPAGMQEWTSQDRLRRDDVVRTFYVGITRARERLVLCQPASPLAVDLGWHVRRRGNEN